MKAKLIFDLNDPDDKESHIRCVKATNAYIALLDIKDKLRAHIKYNPDKLDEDTLEQLSEEFWEILDDNSIDLENEIT